MAHALVIFHDLDEVAPIESAVIDLARDGFSVHLLSVDDGPALSEEMAPRRLRLMLLLAKLADRQIPVTGEDAGTADVPFLRSVIGVQDADVVFVAGSPDSLDRLLDLRSTRVPVLPLPVPQRARIAGA